VFFASFAAFCSLNLRDVQFEVRCKSIMPPLVFARSGETIKFYN